MGGVEPLVSTAWLHDALSEQSSTPSTVSTSCPLRVLDASWLGFKTEGRDAYRSTRIPGARYFDFNQCRDKTSLFTFTLPSPEEFASYVGGLGIDNNTHVVIYENDPVFRMIAGPRTWWMFRVFGHDKVSLVNGGLKQWRADGFPCESGEEPEVERKEFVAKQPRADLLKDYDQVLENQKTGSFTLIDSRPPEWFDGSMDSIWPELPLGHIRQTVNVPFSSFLNEDNDRMIAPDDIRKLFQSLGVDIGRPIASSCFVGASACMVALGAFIVGKRDVAVYDGSWDEFCKKAPKDAYVTVPEPGSKAQL